MLIVGWKMNKTLQVPFTMCIYIFFWTLEHFREFNFLKEVFFPHTDVRTRTPSSKAALGPAAFAEVLLELQRPHNTFDPQIVRRAQTVYSQHYVQGLTIISLIDLIF